MKLSALEQRLYDAFARFDIIDAHEHLAPESVRTEMKVDVFTLFSHYTLPRSRAFRDVAG